MNTVIVVNKPLGLTPLKALEQLRKDKPELTGEVLSYAGRLDPMAEGVMLVLIGETNKKREKYLAMDKEYDFEMITGITTDSYDLLGLVERVNLQVKVTEVEVGKAFGKYVGQVTLPYPPFSSKTVKGKPLWWWVREGRLSKIDLPINSFEVYTLETLKSREISAQELLSEIDKKIKRVKGNFRQEEILKVWQKKLNGMNCNFLVFTCRMSCSSGTYVRSIVAEVGEKLRVGAVVYSIKRTRIDRFLLPRS